MKRIIFYGTLFEDALKDEADSKVVLDVSPEVKCVKEKDRRERRLLNKHLLPKNFKVEGMFQLPLVHAYTGPIPEAFVSYGTKSEVDAKYVGMYCNIDDYKFSSTWSKPESSLEKVKKFSLAVGPDHTLWLDGLVCENVEQLRRNRITTLYWQENGCPTIPSASWGDAYSVDNYAFDGLPEHSYIAIGHQRIGNKCEQRLFKYAVLQLVEKKHPIGLIIFGEKLDFNPGVSVRYFPSHISKLRML